MNSTKVVTGVVRLSYANIWEPASINGSNPKYSVSLIIPKSDTKTLDAINAAVDAAIKEGAAKFGGKIPNKAALKLPLRDGDTERDDEAYNKSYLKFPYPTPNGETIPLTSKSMIAALCSTVSLSPGRSAAMSSSSGHTWSRLASLRDWIIPTVRCSSNHGSPNRV